MSPSTKPTLTAADCSTWTLQKSGKVGQHELQFSIRGPSARRTKDALILSLSEDLMERAGLSFGDKLELRHQPNEKLFALMPSADGNGMTIRKEHKRRGYLHAVCSGSLGAFWSFDPITAEPLPVMQVGHGLIVFAEPDFEPTSPEEEVEP